MNITEKIRKSIGLIVETARLAPSVHNTQPWKVSIADDKCIVEIDRDYQLSAGDPTMRQTIISLGIFAEAISIVATRYRLSTKKIWLEKNKANIQFSDTNSRVKFDYIKALKSRATDRSIYRSFMVSNKYIEKIKNLDENIDARVWVITNKDDINLIAKLTSNGIGVALSSPEFRNELSKYLVLPWSTKKRGISTSSLYIPKLISFCEPILIRLGIGIKSEVKLEYNRWLSASGVVLITTEGDMPEYWFEAGRAYLYVALNIENLGLSQATSAATVEASNYHEDVENLVNTDQRLQCVLRFGKGVAHRNHSPRVSIEDLIT